MKTSLYFAAITLCVVMPCRAAELANSVMDFSGVQGTNGWTWGWRNYTADGGGDESYNASTSFLPFTTAQWNGTIFKIGGNPPWTQMGADGDCHPNSPHAGSALANSEHWVIRRWKGEALTADTPLRVTLAFRKTNLNGGGTTGALYQNGVRKFSQAVAGNDGIGYNLDYFVNMRVGDILDFAMTPVDFDGARGDGSDGSAFSMIVNDDLGSAPYSQPDGTPFEPATAADTDADGMPDSWERSYTTPPDLTTFTATGDFDSDGLNDPGEYTRNTNPTQPDTDGDGLSDNVETKTGAYVSVTNTGSNPTSTDSDGDTLGDGAEVDATPRTDPNKADTDADTYSDSQEVLYGSNPTVPTDTPLSQAAADSITEFSGVQGQNDWEYGYRNVTESGIGTSPNYDPVAAFKKFAGGSNNPEPWTGGVESTQHWNTDKWDLQNGAPWTEMGSEGTHPNGINNTDEHWTIRRWKATELTGATAVAIIWHVRKTNPSDDGVTGAVFVNGRLLDSKVIAGNDSAGVIRRVYAVLQPADVVDLVHTPVGITHSGDGADGSAMWMRVDKRIPAQPVSSDGAFFAAPGAPDTDGDGLADAWEIYSTADSAADPPVAGSLTVLTASSGDNDSDGLTNVQEQTRGSSPVLADTDGDGLNDNMETGTWEFSTGIIGTSPRRADSDEDGLSDSAEVNAVQLKSNPVLANSDGDIYNDSDELRRVADPAVTTTYVGGQVDGGLAHSVRDFSTTQGPPWFYGYRNLTVDGGGAYDADTHFIALEEAGNWDLGPGNPPWTSLTADGAHPNGPNNAEVHWAVRRWVADAAGFPVPKNVALWWHIHKTGRTPVADGVTGSLFLNGQLLDRSAIRGGDLQGVVRIYYVNVKAGDKIDFALQHNNPDEGEMEGFDYSDGSVTILRIEDIIPANAVQPDGSPFPPVASGGAFQVTSVVRNAANGQVTLTWPSQTGKTYDVFYSETLAAGSWSALTPAAGIPGTGSTLNFIDTTAAPAQPAKTRIFYRVRER